ncbi:MAG: hypothetical protein KBC73_13490 [Burkholderiaceae bacterium]|nr:hypothetical protein [Burkholderiaceae bacterium]
MLPACSTWAELPSASFQPLPPALPRHGEFGLPQDRHARIAARRSFVALKQRFMNAVALLDEHDRASRATWLRWQVRQTQEVLDLWLLRGAVFEALSREGRTAERVRGELHEALDSVFPDHGELLPYGVRA